MGARLAHGPGSLQAKGRRGDRNRRQRREMSWHMRRRSLRRPRARAPAGRPADTRGVPRVCACRSRSGRCRRPTGLAAAAPRCALAVRACPGLGWAVPAFPQHSALARPLTCPATTRSPPPAPSPSLPLPAAHTPQGGDTITAHLDTEVVDKLPTDQLAPPVPEVVRCGGRAGRAGRGRMKGHQRHAVAAPRRCPGDPDVWWLAVDGSLVRPPGRPPPQGEAHPGDRHDHQRRAGAD